MIELMHCLDLRSLEHPLSLNYQTIAVNKTIVVDNIMRAQIDAPITSAAAPIACGDPVFGDI
jgi:hypothetical protein